MRAPLLGDVVAAARSLMAVTQGERQRRLSQLMIAAETAERHRRRTGSSHLRHGDGSLMAASLAHGVVPEPSLGDRDYCLSLAMVLTELAASADSGLRSRGPLSS
jgi:hypothetical protein